MSAEVRPILLVAALEIECRTLRRDLDGAVRLRSAVTGWRGMHRGISVVVVRCGAGPACADAAIQRALRVHEPAVVLSCGIAGGLSGAVRVGDVVLPDNVLLETIGTGTSWGQTPSPGGTEVFRPDHRLLAAATEALATAGTEAHRGRLLTCARTASTAREKAALAARYSAVAVDRESAVILKAARDLGVPALVVRTISDGADDGLEVVSDIDVDRLAGRLRILGRIVCRPSLAWELQRLRRDTACALEHLASAINRIVGAVATTYVLVSLLFGQPSCSFVA